MNNKLSKFRILRLIEDVICIKYNVNLLPDDLDFKITVDREPLQQGIAILLDKNNYYYKVEWRYNTESRVKDLILNITRFKIDDIAKDISINYGEWKEV